MGSICSIGCVGSIGSVGSFHTFFRSEEERASHCLRKKQECFKFSMCYMNSYEDLMDSVVLYDLQVVQILLVP